MSRYALLLTLLCSSAWSQTDIPDAFYIPDLERNPSFINTDVTQDNLSVTVCTSGWTNSIRTDVHGLESLERGLPGSLSDYREDHIVLLCAGSHPSGERNLWPPFQSFCRTLCLGDITLEAAQAIFLAPDRRVEYERVFSQ
jgi:hypothetical protein